MTAQRTTLMAIADEGWRLRIDTAWLSSVLYGSPVQMLSEDRALEMLSFLVEQGDVAEVGGAIYDWTEDE